MCIFSGPNVQIRLASLVELTLKTSLYPDIGVWAKGSFWIFSILTCSFQNLQDFILEELNFGLICFGE
jgi:hypothetical protein